MRVSNDEQGAYLLYNLAADPEEQNDLAVTNTKIRERLIRQLDRSLREMKAEMPIKNTAFKPDSKGQRYHLKATKDRAEKEREMFEARLGK